MRDWKWYRLQPKQPSADFERVSLAFDDRGRAAPAWSSRTSSARSRSSSFSDVQGNVKLDRALFEFSPPQGADVIGEAAP